DLLAERLANAAASPESPRVVLRALARAGLKETPDTWVEGLTALLAGDRELLPEALATARALPIAAPKAEKLTTRLLEIAGDAKAPASVRLAAVAAVPGGLPSADAAALDFLRTQLDPGQPVSTRTLAADVLAKAKLTPDQLVALADPVKAAGPLELDRVL